MINKRQAIILIVICSLATKLQRLPSLISAGVGRDGWVVLLILGILDLLFLWLMMWFFNRHNKTATVYEVIEVGTGKFVAKIIDIVLFVYFVLMAVLPFEAIHDLFANVLFDQINYNYFGLIFLVVVIFMSLKGLQTLGRQGEIYAGVIGFGIIGVLLLGLSGTHLDRILPILDIDAKDLFLECLKDTIWFGDFMILLFLTGKVSIKDNSKMGWSLVIPYGVVVLIFIPLAYIIFFTIYNNLAGLQNNAISSLTQFSLLELDIGRVDWYLVLLEQISTILSSSVFIFIAGSSFCEAFGIEKQTIPIIVISVLLYAVDLTIFINMETSVPLFREISYMFCAVVNYILPFVFVIASIIYGKKNKNAKQQNVNQSAKVNNVNIQQGIGKNEKDGAPKNQIQSQQKTKDLQVVNFNKNIKYLKNGYYNSKIDAVNLINAEKLNKIGASVAYMWLKSANNALNELKMTKKTQKDQHKENVNTSKSPKKAIKKKTHIDLVKRTLLDMAGGEDV